LLNLEGLRYDFVRYCRQSSQIRYIDASDGRLNNTVVFTKCAIQRKTRKEHS